MRFAMAFVLATGLLSAETVSAQEGPLTGTWSLNIPQFPPLPSSLNWDLVDSGATFEGETSITFESLIRVDGTLTGQQWFGPIYFADSSLTATVLVPGVPVPIPPLPTSKSILFVFGNSIGGFALQSINGTPVNVYQVHGTRVPQ
ncbi:MAG TPA: hypothetical protein VFG20_18715 [Planctomycetaceae bacterium]|nr:hypothetical protein [Planctomycetaceae bacterium]